jgi:hypothetical protein
MLVPERVEAALRRKALAVLDEAHAAFFLGNLRSELGWRTRFGPATAIAASTTR